MRKLIFLTLLFYFGMRMIYRSGYKRTSDKDFIIDDLDTARRIKSLPYDTSIYPLIKKDSTPYKGEWIDVN